MVVMAAVAISADGAAATVEPRAVASRAVAQTAPMAVPAAVPASAPASVSEAEDEPVCVRIKGAEACVGPDGSDRPGITIEDTARDKLHPAVEYYLNGYLGTKYVIHNLGREGDVRGSREIGKMVTFRAAIYEGNHQVRYGRWKTVRNIAKYPVKRETRVTPAAARARAKVCTTIRGALTCFAERNTYIFACDTQADKYQARAEYFVGGDPTARFEIHQLAGVNTCGKAEHGDLAISMYRTAVFNDKRRVADQLYRYN
ncbi:hypothetical protein ETD86_11755 [Nonomuraea turkmeniaca]|uniref:Uncharacterized protein n=1 Tax=Nonomuraea turkmeniaca TaxID=103838 RepID=A0A5S4FNP5_9ACTN|nr:hypothetical protein [Nonomuraea turkmeniaca]TMR22367.1 hypothetical protein ETD86_11755 [Nonomuraea turkmeniaca]